MREHSDTRRASESSPIKTRPTTPADTAPVRSLAADLQQFAGNRALARLMAPAPAVMRVEDQRAGTGELSTRQIRAIDQQLHPTASSGSGSRAARLWDGRSGAPNYAARRIQLRSELLAAMRGHLAAQMPGIRELADPARTPRTNVANFRGAGLAAKHSVDSEFQSRTAAAALTRPQRHLQANFDFDPGTELVDRSDPGQFRTAPGDLADWIAQTDGNAQAAQRRHGFDKFRPGSSEEATWLETKVIRPFATSHRTDLDLYDRFGFADTTRRRITLVPALPPGPAAAGPGGRPPERLRRAQWDAFQLLVHEYIHTLEHPAFGEAHGGNRVLFEGFCEHFTLKVLNDWVPRARARDASLLTQVEGAAPNGRPWPGFNPRWIATPGPGAYADYVQRTRRMKRTIGSGGENALRGAFFQGHVELIGLQPSGLARTRRLDLTDRVHVPHGIPDREALSRASGISQRLIRARNPSLSLPTSPVRAGTEVLLRGCREHVIAEASPTWDAPGGSPAIETPAQIAAQHGRTEAAIRRANPAVNWSALNAGDRVLVPRR